MATWWSSHRHGRRRRTSPAFDEEAALAPGDLAELDDLFAAVEAEQSGARDARVALQLSTLVDRGVPVPRRGGGAGVARRSGSGSPTARSCWCGAGSRVTPASSPDGSGPARSSRWRAQSGPAAPSWSSASRASPTARVAGDRTRPARLRAARPPRYWQARRTHWPPFATLPPLCRPTDFPWRSSAWDAWVVSMRPRWRRSTRSSRRARSSRSPMRWKGRGDRAGATGYPTRSGAGPPRPQSGPDRASSHRPPGARPGGSRRRPSRAVREAARPRRRRRSPPGGARVRGEGPRPPGRLLAAVRPAMAGGKARIDAGDIGTRSRPPGPVADAQSRRRRSATRR